MTPTEILGDDALRVEAKARADAERGAYDPPTFPVSTLWSQVFSNAAVVCYFEQFSKRIQRIRRMT